MLFPQGIVLHLKKKKDQIQIKPKKKKNQTNQKSIILTSFLDCNKTR